MLIVCKKKIVANIQACRYVVQDCSNKSNPRIGISLHTSNSNFELALRKSFVRAYYSNFNPRGLFKICSVHFAYHGFEQTVHLEGASRRLISEFKSSENVAQNCKFEFINLFRHSPLSHSSHLGLTSYTFNINARPRV